MKQTFRGPPVVDPEYRVPGICVYVSQNHSVAHHNANDSYCNFNICVCGSEKSPNPLPFCYISTPFILLFKTLFSFLSLPRAFIFLSDILPPPFGGAINSQ